MRGWPSIDIRMTEVMPAIAPSFTSEPSHASCGCASSATATGASAPSFWYGTMPVMTAAIAT